MFRLFFENIREALKAIQSNKLRASLTGLIIAIGITALVGILTAIEGIKASVTENLSELGASAFEVRKQGMSRRRHGGNKDSKQYPDISYQQTQQYRKMYKEDGITTVFTDVSFSAEVKFNNKKTNPNINVIGGDIHYLSVKSIQLAEGRNFTEQEANTGAFVCILGNNTAEQIFTQQSPLGQTVQLLGGRYRVIGVAAQMGGSFGGGGLERGVLIPLENARQVARGQSLNFSLVSTVSRPEKMDESIENATSLMRAIRGDRPGAANSFQILRSESLYAALNDITNTLRIAGIGIGLITMLGAAIGLMNIMLVSVTERTREIGIRKALGATTLAIKQQFLVEAVVICLLGGFTGIIIGIAAGNMVSSLTGANSFVIPWLWIAIAFAVCVLVGIISGYYPAKKAAQVDPISSLRYE